MADIHVLVGTVQDEYVTQYRYVLHVPTGADAGLQAHAVQDPNVSGFESIVPNIEQTELDDIRAGVLVEEVYSISYHRNDDPADYLARLQAEWGERAAAGGVPDEFERRYQWFGNEYGA